MTLGLLVYFDLSYWGVSIIFICYIVYFSYLLFLVKNLGTGQLLSKKRKAWAYLNYASMSHYYLLVIAFGAQLFIHIHSYEHSSSDANDLIIIFICTYVFFVNLKTTITILIYR